MSESCHVLQRLHALQGAGLVALLSAMFFFAWCAQQAARPPAPQTADVDTDTWPGGDILRTPIIWQAAVFPKNIAAKAPVDGALAQRYRLAGTFFAVGEHHQSRKAILDDLQQQDQILVGEGDQLGAADVLVVSINTDFILLRAGGRDEKLRLSFADGPHIDTVKSDASPIAAADSGMLARFGARVEDRRWLLKRAALLDYYQEVMADTARLAQIFESLKPVYKASRISGYVLDVEGEKEMFNAFGLQQNDVIRKVNSMPMTSQNRAEYFIREFVNNRVNGFVLDIERDGKPQKFVYLVR